MDEFELTGEERAWRGQIITAGTAHYRHADGVQVTRDAVWHPGAVGVLAVGEGYVWLTRQPREVAGLADSLEIPAGKLDVPGEAPLETGKRELVEEVGVTAAHWEPVYEFFTSPGFSNETVWLFLATDLNELATGAEPDEGERISAERWPLDRLDDALAQSRDSKTLIALLWLQVHAAELGAKLD
jgi:8-oxo-dGTP pyrophosphatase MutT (NUDIX family)